MKNKRIISITISDEDRYVYIKDYPIIYESEKEIVFLISYGTSKTIYKSNCFYDSLSDDKIIDFFKRKETSHLYCTSLDTKLSGRNLYIKSREVEIINELTEAKNNISSMHNKLMHDIDEYNELIETYRDCDFIKDGDYETIKLF